MLTIFSNSEKITGKSIKVTLGAYDYYGSSHSDGDLVLSDKFWIHENFSMPSAVNDIGIIKLPVPIVPSDKVDFIGIETKAYPDYDFKKREVVIAGWGHVRPSRPAKQLMYTKMKLLPLNVCYRYKSHYIESLTARHICATKISGMPCE